MRRALLVVALPARARRGGLRQGLRGPRARRLRGRGDQARPGRGPQGADRLGQHPHRGRHARRRRERVLGDRQERRRRRRAPDDRLGLLPLARHLQRRPHEGPDLRGGRLAAGRARRLDPRPVDRAGDPPRRAGRHPRRLDQLGREPVARPRRARARRPARDARRLPGRQAHGGLRREARDLRQAGAAQQRARPALRRLRARDARGRREREQLRPRRHRPRHRRAQAAGRAGGAQGRRRPDPLERRGQDVARGQEGGRPRDQGEARHLRPLARDPRGGQGRADAVRGRPAGLPPGLHADRDADPADPLRPLPVEGADRVHRAELRDEGERRSSRSRRARAGSARPSGGAPRAAAPGSASRRRPG